VGQLSSRVKIWEVDPPATAGGTDLVQVRLVTA
jgi:hypothetical protein